MSTLYLKIDIMNQLNTVELRDTILSIQNTEIETLGNFKELFESEGYKIKTVHVKKDSISSRWKVCCHNHTGRIHVGI